MRVPVGVALNTSGHRLSHQPHWMQPDSIHTRRLGLVMAGRVAPQAAEAKVDIHIPCSGR